MKKSRPLVDKEAEVRELRIEDIRAFRPIAELATPSLAAKLAVQTKQTTDLSPKRSAAARRGGLRR